MNNDNPEAKACAAIVLFVTATIWVFLPVCRAGLHAFEVAPIDAWVFFAGSAAAVTLGLGLSWCARTIAGKARTRLRRLRLLQSLPPGRTRREKLETLKNELEAAEKAERDRLEEAGKKIEDAGKAADLWVPWTAKDFPPSEVPVVVATNRSDHITGGPGDLIMSGHGQTFTLNTKTEPALRGYLGGLTSIVGALNALEMQADQYRKLNDRKLEDALKKIATSPRKEAVYDTETYSSTGTYSSDGLRLVPLPSSNAVAGRPRKEPVWERRVFQTDSSRTVFFSGQSINDDGTRVQTNMYGMHGGLPQGHHLFWYNLAVRFDHEPPSDWLARSKISFSFTTSRLLSLPLGTVYDAGITGRDVIVSGRPVEINALEGFTVCVETEGYKGPVGEVGMTVSLNGILVKGICG